MIFVFVFEVQIVLSLTCGTLFKLVVSNLLLVYCFLCDMVWQALPGLFYTYLDPDMELPSSLKDSASFYEKCYIETCCGK